MRLLCREMRRQQAASADTKALTTPASRRCTSKGADAVKKPLAAMNSVASTEPQSNTRVGALRRTSRDMASAPIR
jgi:hypothetical protein